MAKRVTLHLSLTLRAENAADGSPICVHSGLLKETVDLENIEDGKKTLVSLLYNTAEVVGKIGGEKDAQ